MTTPSNVTAVRGLVHFDIGWEKQGTVCRFHYSHSTFNFSTDARAVVAQSAEPLKRFYWPDKPPALQVLLDDLHGDPFLKADFILPLTGVRLYCHIFLLWWKEKGRQSEWNVVIKQSHTEGLNYCYSLHLPRGPYEGKMANVTYLKCSDYFNTNTNTLPLSNSNNQLPLLAEPLPFSPCLASFKLFGPRPSVPLSPEGDSSSSSRPTIGASLEEIRYLDQDLSTLIPIWPPRCLSRSARLPRT